MTVATDAAHFGERTLPTTDGVVMTADQFAVKWSQGDIEALAYHVVHGRIPRACTCDDYPEKHWAMARLEPDEPLFDRTIEWEPGDPAYGRRYGDFSVSERVSNDDPPSVSHE